jgi:hypothetical protein
MKNLDESGAGSGSGKGFWDNLFSFGKKSSVPAVESAVTETPPPQTGAVNA